MLTETAIKNAKPKDKRYKLSDAGGLYIEVSTSGGKHWRMKYRYDGKEKVLSIGSYPAISLKLARDARDQAKEQLAQGIDPSAAKQQEKAQRKAQVIEQEKIEERIAYTFEHAFNDWYNLKQQGWKAKHAQAVEGRYRLWLAPSLNSLPLSEITPAQCISTIKRIEETGKLESRDKVRSIMGQIFRYAVSTGKLDTNPARDLSNDVFVKNPRSNFAHQTDPKRIREIYRLVCSPYGGYIATSNAMKLLALTFLRVTELTGLKWYEVDFNNRVLRISAERMKMKREHITPLSRQALAILNDQREHHTGGDYVFPSTLSRTRPITGETLLAGMRRQGIDKTEFTNHGWRHTASTVLHEAGYTPQAIEAQLAHIVKGVAGVYNKALHLEERASMMQAWADWLEDLKG